MDPITVAIATAICDYFGHNREAKLKAGLRDKALQELEARLADDADSLINQDADSLRQEVLAELGFDRELKRVGQNTRAKVNAARQSSDNGRQERPF